MKTNWYDWIFDASKRSQVSRTLTIEDVERMASDEIHQDREGEISFHLQKNVK